LGLGLRLERLLKGKTEERADALYKGAERLVDPLHMGKEYKVCRPPSYCLGGLTDHVGQQVMGVTPKLETPKDGDEVFPFGVSEQSDHVKK
jgi:hypothetical protein